jgi:hypothetical protein
MARYTDPVTRIFDLCQVEKYWCVAGQQWPTLPSEAGQGRSTLTFGPRSGLNALLVGSGLWRVIKGTNDVARHSPNRCLSPDRTT